MNVFGGQLELAFFLWNAGGRLLLRASLDIAYVKDLNLGCGDDIAPVVVVKATLTRKIDDEFFVGVEFGNLG